MSDDQLIQAYERLVDQYREYILELELALGITHDDEGELCES